MKNQYKQPITLDGLIEELIIYKSFHRDAGNLPIYHDGLHLVGEIIKSDLNSLILN